MASSQPGMFHQVLLASSICIDILYTLRKDSKPYVKCFFIGEMATM